MIRFLVPWALLALLLPLGVVLLSRRRALWGRALTMTLLVVALAQPQLLQRDVDRTLLVLVDRSESTGAEAEVAYNALAAQLSGYSGPVGLIEFAATPHLTRAPGAGVPALAGVPPGTERMESDIAAAVDLALGIGGQRLTHIVLVSDGQETRGDLWSSAVRARDRGVSLSTYPVQVVDPVRVASLRGPARAPLGKVILEGQLEVARQSEAEVLWWGDGALLQRTESSLSPGLHTQRLAVTLDRAGPWTFALEVRVDEDPFPANNRLDWVVLAGDAGPVLVVSEDGGAQGLLEQTDMEIRVRPSFSPAELAGVDLVVLDDWPLAGLARTDVDALRSHVAAGGGLLVVQGRRAVEGYTGPLEALLPVTYSVPGRLQESPAAIVFVLDKSASMAAITAGARHIDLLKEATASAVEVMHEEDVVGAIAFDRDPYWLVRPGPVVEVKAELYKALRMLAPSGGTDLVPAVRQALTELEGIELRVRHIVVLSDGKTLPRPDLPDLYEEVATSGVGVTSIALGADADLDALGSLARAGEGEVLVVSDARDLRRVFIGEAKQAARPRYRQGQFSVSIGPGAASMNLSGLELPAIGGYVVTFPRPTAEVGLIAPEGDPIVAGWQLGLGRVAVLNVDLSGRWTEAWVAEPELGRLWGSLVGWLWAPREDVELSWSIDAGVLHVQLDVQYGERWVSDRHFRGEISGPGGAQALTFSPTGPGQYMAESPYEGAGPHVLSVWDDSGQFGGTFGLALPYPTELARLGPDLEVLSALAELTGGTLLGDELPPAARPGRVWVPVERSLLWAAAFAFLADLALRKLRFPPPRGRHAGRA